MTKNNLDLYAINRMNFIVNSGKTSFNELSLKSQ